MKKIFSTIILSFNILMMCACGNNATVAQNNATNEDVRKEFDEFLDNIK